MARNNEVRIIGGQWKGRKLRFPEHPGLRPTLGRVRETLFNWLAPHVAGAHCLDLYAGSGALGFEALSRGAAQVTFVERDRKTAAALRANVTLLEAQAVVRQQDAARFLAGSTGRFDLILLDPPFDMDPSRLPLSRLLEEHLSPGGFLYLESSRRLPARLPATPVRSGTAGECTFVLFAAPEAP
jgi:16S rRNA (guanine966-N2)-methyltransferase